MTKDQIRKLYLQKRNSLSETEIQDFSEMIFKNFIEHFKPIENQKVHCFLTISEKREINTECFLSYFFKNKIRVFVPKIFNDRLISVEITENTRFVKNSWSISEPESNDDSGETNYDYVLTPLLYCDFEGNRVGYGKGFYDEFFENVEASSLKVGLNFFNPEVKIDDIRTNDIPLNYLVTPTAVLSF